MNSSHKDEHRRGKFSKIHSQLFLKKMDSSPLPLLKIKCKNYKLLDGSTKCMVSQVSDGSIIKRFDKTPFPQKETDVICPHFLELKWGTGCPFDCSWCYLKGTFRFLPYNTKPRVKSFSKIKRHLFAFMEQVNEPEILNSGELADSLMHEGNKHSFCKFIIPLFESQQKHKLLLLTKSAHITPLREVHSHKQIIASFTLNAMEIANRWEKKAPSVKKRIKAAQTLSRDGYDIRIRIDPLVPTKNWEKAYKELMDILFTSFRPERITFGSLRGLQSTINCATDISWVKYLSESSNWGKKVDAEVRTSMYRNLISHISKKYNYENVALCKETISVWRKLGLDYQKIRCNCIL